MKRMDFEAFVNLVKDSILNWLPESYSEAEVRLQTVKKNNNMELRGLTILLPERNITPTIYLEEFYKKYKNGVDIAYILEEIADIQIEHEVQTKIDTRYFTELELCRDKIVPRLVSAEWNEEELANIPHVLMEDLAIIFCLDLGKDEHGTMSVKIYNGMLEYWNLSTEELYEIALENLRNNTEYLFTTLRDTMIELMIPDAMRDYEVDREEAIKILEEEIPQTETMFVLSNMDRVYGASTVLNTEIMNKIVEKYGEIYVIPASVHEVLIVPANLEPEVDRLRLTVKDVNSSQVSWEERLSDNVYIYNLEQGLKIA